MKNLTIKYFINLVSDINKKAAENAKAIEAGSKRQSKAMELTEKAASKTDKAIAAVGKTTSLAKVEGDAKRAASALDKTAEAARRANADMNRIGTGSSSFERTNRYLQQMAQRMDKVRASARQMGAMMRTADNVATGAVAGGVTAAALVRRPMSFDARLANMSNVAFADRDLGGRISGMGELEAVINKAVREGGGSRDAAAESLNEMIASGVVKTPQAIQMLPELQKAATASGADVTQLTQIAIRAMQNFGLTADQIPEAMSKAIKAGQEGGFELKDMAKWLPQMMAVSKGMLGMRGMEGFEKLISASQASVITAGTKDGAGNNLLNLLAKINSQDTKRDFEKLGIDLTGSMVKAQKEGIAPLDAFVSFVEQIATKDEQFNKLQSQAKNATGDDQKAILDSMADVLQGSAIGQVIQDREALMALIALMQNKQYVKDVESAVKADTGQARDSNFELIASRASFKAEQAGNEADIARSNTFQQIDGPLQSMLTSVTGLAREFPILTTAVTGLASVAAIWKAASIGSGLSGLFGAGKGAAAAAAKAASAAPKPYNPFSGLGVAGVPPPVAATGMASKAGGLLRKAGWLGLGLTAVDVGSTLMDDKKSAAEKTNAVGRTAAGVAGAWGGAKAGALAGGALGSVVPILGTGIGAALGGLVGGGLGWWGATSLGDKLANNSAMQPNAALAGMQGTPPKVEVDLKNGRLAVDVTVRDDRVQVRSTAVQHLNGVQIDTGSTNPAGK